MYALRVSSGVRSDFNFWRAHNISNFCSSTNSLRNKHISGDQAYSGDYFDTRNDTFVR